MKQILHVGCGPDPLPTWLQGSEVRLDIDESHHPDIVADMRTLGDIGPFDAVFSQHSLEHIYPHEVLPTLEGFKRVLRKGGAVIIIVPDLEGVEPTEDVLYESPGGPITGLDLYYGCARMVAHNQLMSHHCGFTRKLLTAVLEKAGFSDIQTHRFRDWSNLFALGIA